MTIQKSGLTDKEEEPNIQGRKWRWRQWHERETQVKIKSRATNEGALVEITSKQLTNRLHLAYPNRLWSNYPRENKSILLDNIAYIFTAHLPFLLKGNIRMEYNTGYPHCFSWASQCFMRNLPAYWYLYSGRRGSGAYSLLKTLLNSRCFFSRKKDSPPNFPSTEDERVLIPFTFGKDSFLTYWAAKEIGLKPILVCYNDPMNEGFEGVHRKKLFRKFSKIASDQLYYIDNPLGSLREPGEGSFGWEMLLTSWVILSMPIAYKHKAGYILYSNEQSVNNFFYDLQGFKVIPDYEQSAQAVEELSILSQTLTEGEVYTTTFIQGLEDLGIIAILKERYFKYTFKHLMSCWAETESARTKRWCAQCSKCARLYVYLSANGISPIGEAEFKDNMFQADKAHLYNVFGKKAAGTGWDAFGLNYEEQMLAFYLTWLRGNRDPLVQRFAQSPAFLEAEERYEELIDKYYSLCPEDITPLQWKKRIDAIFAKTLDKARRNLKMLRNF